VHGHTGDPVPVRAWGVRAEEVAGVRNHAEFGRWLRDVMELSRDAPAAGNGTTPIDTEQGRG
jgi:alkaline phosphatase